MDIEELKQNIETVRYSMSMLKNLDVSFSEFRVLLINRYKLSWSESKRQALEMERISQITLERP